MKSNALRIPQGLNNLESSTASSLHNWNSKSIPNYRGSSKIYESFIWRTPLNFKQNDADLETKQDNKKKKNSWRKIEPKQDILQKKYYNSKNNDQKKNENEFCSQNTYALEQARNVTQNNKSDSFFIILVEDEFQIFPIRDFLIVCWTA